MVDDLWDLYRVLLYSLELITGYFQHDCKIKEKWKEIYENLEQGTNENGIHISPYIKKLIFDELCP